MIKRSLCEDEGKYDREKLDSGYIHNSHRNFCLTYIRETIGMEPEADGKRDVFRNNPFLAVRNVS